MKTALRIGLCVLIAGCLLSFAGCKKKADEAKTALRAFLSKLDKAASKGIVHRNAASRKSSRLEKRISGLSKA